VKNLKKYIFITFLDLILLIPLSFGVFTQYLSIKEINPPIILVIIIGLIGIFLFGLFIQRYGYNKLAIEMMKNHDVTATFLENEAKIILFLFFPLTMLMEELIFRLYLIGLMITILNLNTISIILLASLIFSIYHLHFWFKFKNLRITLIFIAGSFLMGILLSFTLITLGLVFCVAFHLSITLLMYYSLAKKIKHVSNKPDLLI